MGKNLKHRCPECGGLLSQATSRDNGYRCGTDGCDIQKVFINVKGEITRIVRSSIPKRSLSVVTQRLSDILLYEKGLVMRT